MDSLRRTTPILKKWKENGGKKKGKVTERCGISRIRKKKFKKAILRRGKIKARKCQVNTPAFESIGKGKGKKVTT